MARLAASVVMLMIAGGVAGCSGGLGTGGTPTAPTPTRVPVSDADIQRIVGNFARGATNAANTTSVSSALRLPSAPGLLVGKMATFLVNESFSQRTSCETGGYHETVGRISGTVSDTGISRLQMNATQSINSYACMGGGWIINGDPYVSNTGEIRITGNVASFDFRQSLGWRANNSNTGQSFSCSHNISVTWSDLSGGRVQGNVTCSPPSTTVSINMTF